MVHTLPPTTSLSPSVLTFLDDNLHSRDELDRASGLVSELQTRCADLDRSLVDLNHRLESSLFAYASYSDQVGGLFGDVNSKLSDLRSSTRISGSQSGENMYTAIFILFYMHTGKWCNMQGSVITFV